MKYFHPNAFSDFMQWSVGQQKNPAAVTLPNKPAHERNNLENRVDFKTNQDVGNELDIKLDRRLALLRKPLGHEDDMFHGL
jgi:hypothetical protein